MGVVSGKVEGIFTFFTPLLQWPDRAPVGGRKCRGEERGSAG